jgi:hypothetical protein
MRTIIEGSIRSILPHFPAVRQRLALQQSPHALKVPVGTWACASKTPGSTTPPSIQIHNHYDCIITALFTKNGEVYCAHVNGGKELPASEASLRAIKDALHRNNETIASAVMVYNLTFLGETLAGSISHHLAYQAIREQFPGVKMDLIDAPGPNYSMVPGLGSKPLTLVPHLPSTVAALFNKSPSTQMETLASTAPSPYAHVR